MQTKKTFDWGIALALILGLAASLYVVLPILFDSNVVQDDFRQSYFWVWRYWDPELFENSLLKDAYPSHLIRTPLLHFIYWAAHLITTDLIFFNKVIAITIGTFTSLFAYLCCKSISKDRFLALIFTATMSCIIWFTDHVSNGCTRAFLWIGIYAYFYYKNEQQDFKAALVTFLCLMMSPFTFLLCLCMEGFNFVVNFPWKEFFGKETKSLSQYATSFWSIVFNAGLCAFMYLFLFKDVSTQGSGETFTIEEMKHTAEFLPGGRHPIFDIAGASGSWLDSMHWGLPLGKLSAFELGGIFILIGVMLIYAFANKERAKAVFSSKPIMLLYSSSFLYLIAVFTYPLLYLPNRYIAIPWLLLIIFTGVLFVNDILEGISCSFGIKPIVRQILWLMIVTVIPLNASGLARPSYLRMNAELAAQIKALPKDVLIASHPKVHDLNMVPIVTKRAVFVDHERSMVYGKAELMEIRRRTKASFDMFYATSEAELRRLMAENKVTHFIAHPRFYEKKFLDKPWYMKPYQRHIKTVIKTNRPQGFFLQQWLGQREYRIYSL